MLIPCGWNDNLMRNQTACGACNIRTQTLWRTWRGFHSSPPLPPNISNLLWNECASGPIFQALFVFITVRDVTEMFGGWTFVRERLMMYCNSAFEVHHDLRLSLPEAHTSIADTTSFSHILTHNRSQKKDARHPWYMTNSLYKVPNTQTSQYVTRI